MGICIESADESIELWCPVLFFKLKPVRFWLMISLELPKLLNFCTIYSQHIVKNDLAFWWKGNLNSSSESHRSLQFYLRIAVEKNESPQKRPDGVGPFIKNNLIKAVKDSGLLKMEFEFMATHHPLSQLLYREASIGRLERIAHVEFVGGRRSQQSFNF